MWDGYLWKCLFCDWDEHSYIWTIMVTDTFAQIGGVFQMAAIAHWQVMSGPNL